ncbi:urate hydroxylase PuuD [Zhongshania sp.]|uniref:urate hydroxylase PuuD n=1 Tax=Zhongshania sp. TaxID=1971902 RepID=UPI0035673C9C
MSAYTLDWLNLLLRWIHLITGIAWIGASFYFVWLDNSLEEASAENKQKGLAGQLSSIHAGGFYEVGKYQLAPPEMPTHLHWFKWEAYSTWISGFLLLSLMFYVGANSYLIDNSKLVLQPWQAIAISLTTLIGGWLIYHLLCKSPLANNSWLLAGVLLAFITGLSWGLGQIFSARAAYLHIGALIGSCMAANVFFVIMPGQRALVAAVAAGRPPAPKHAKASKLRSVHNNYLTLPVLFLMISNHYPMTYGHPHAWAVLLAILLIGAWTRHFFNLRHKGVVRPSILVSAAIAVILLAWAMAPAPLPAVDADQALVSDQQALSIVQQHCSSCHSAAPHDEMFTVAPAGVMLDTLAEIRQWAPRIRARAINSRDMPFMNKTEMSDAERATLGQWLQQATP